MPCPIAIIIPTFNRPTRLAQCLAHLAELEGGPYRTVVVDDGGDQPLEAICHPYRDWVELVHKANGGPAAARNTGAQAAEGAELLAFLDDDCQPRPDWIVQLARTQANVGNRLVGGRVENALSDNVWSSASQTLCSYLYDYFLTRGSDMAFFTSNNLCCRREDFLARGGFDEHFPIAAGEDRELGIRWREQGGELVYAFDAIIDHAHDLDLAGFWRQQSNYGRGARQLHLTLGKRGNQRPKLERAGFYLGMLSYPLRKRAPRPIAEALLIGLSQVAMVSGYARALLAERSSASS